MESRFLAEYGNQRASGLAIAAEYAYAKAEIAGSSIIAIETPNRSLLLLSQPN
jgi:hypothetical protein